MNFDVLRRFKDVDFKPRPVNSENWRRWKRSELNKLLKTPYQKKWLCWHNWVYWKFGEATRTHRVCSYCYKKQTNTDILGDSTRWVKDPTVDKLHRYIETLPTKDGDS